MPRIIALGNNTAHSLLPPPSATEIRIAPEIRVATEVTSWRRDLDRDNGGSSSTSESEVEIVYHGWTSTVISTRRVNLTQGSDDKSHSVWGDDRFVQSFLDWAADPQPGQEQEQGDKPHQARRRDLKVISREDEPVAILSRGRLWLPTTSMATAQSAATLSLAETVVWIPSKTNWKDVGVTDLGTAVGYTGHGIYRFASLDALHFWEAGETQTGETNTEETATETQHPFFADAQDVSITTTETRVLFLVRRRGGGASHVLELVFDYKSVSGKSGAGSEVSPLPPPATLRLLDDLEGLSVTHLVAGCANRVAALTSAGEVYILDANEGVVALDADDVLAEAGSKSIEAEGQHVESDLGIEHIGLGDGFEVVAIGDRVYGRGSNEFGQLGLRTKHASRWTELPLPGHRGVRQIVAARMSTLIVLGDR